MKAPDDKSNKTSSSIFGGAKAPEVKSNETTAGIFGGAKPTGKTEKIEEGNGLVDSKKTE